MKINPKKTSTKLTKIRRKQQTIFKIDKQYEDNRFILNRKRKTVNIN